MPITEKIPNMTAKRGDWIMINDHEASTIKYVAANEASSPVRGVSGKILVIHLMNGTVIRDDAQCEPLTRLIAF